MKNTNDLIHDPCFFWERPVLFFHPMGIFFVTFTRKGNTREAIFVAILWNLKSMMSKFFFISSDWTPSLLELQNVSLDRHFCCAMFLVFAYGKALRIFFTSGQSIVASTNLNQSHPTSLPRDPGSPNVRGWTRGVQSPPQRFHYHSQKVIGPPGKSGFRNLEWHIAGKKIPPCFPGKYNQHGGFGKASYVFFRRQHTPIARKKQRTIESPKKTCENLGGGFKHLLFSSLFGEMIQFD